MNPGSLAEQLKPYANRILIDRMNYTNKTKGLYKKHKIEKWLDEEFNDMIISKLSISFRGKEVEVC
jgi:hypothetical protein